MLAVWHFGNPRCSKPRFAVLTCCVLAAASLSIAGLAVGCVTPIKDLLVGDDPPLGFFTESLSIMAGGMIPSMMLVLGSVLHKGPGSAKVPKRVIFGILAVRQIIIPILGNIPA